MKTGEMSSLGLMEESVVRELTNIGLGHATTALSELTNRSFVMSVPTVETVPLEELPTLLGGSDQLSVSVYMPREGKISGHIAFLYSWEGAQALWDMLLDKHPAGIDQIDEMYSSTLIEVSNIINSSFLSAISDMTGFSLHATPPMMSIDYTVSILESIVVQAIMEDCVALTIKTRIFDDNGAIDGFFLFIPSVGGLENIFENLGLRGAA